MAQPESITALMVAVGQEEGDEAVRLHAEALAAFERKRVEIVNPALVSRPRAMELRLPFVTPPDLDDFDDLPPDLGELGLDEEVPARPGSAKPKIAPASAKSGAGVLRQGLTKGSGKQVPSPPPETKRIVLPVRRNPPRPPTEPKRIILRVLRKPSPPRPAIRRIILWVWDDPSRPRGSNRKGSSCGFRHKSSSPSAAKKWIALPVQRKPLAAALRPGPLPDADNLRMLVARHTRTPRC